MTQDRVVTALADALRAATVAKDTVDRHGDYLTETEQERLSHDVLRAVQLLARATAYANERQP